MSIAMLWRRWGFVIFLAGFLLLSAESFRSLQAQTRNPVLEFCTGTWCQWCPCGDSTIINQILPVMPNVIVLAYHGGGSDPFRVFPGNDILGRLGLNAYPTGVIDRVSGVRSWGSQWVSSLSARMGVPAGVDIDVTRSYNPATREFNAIIDFTARQTLNGDYNFNCILVEDGQVWGQTSNNTCTPGHSYISDFVHEWVVRSIMNGSTGDPVSSGTWNQGQTITRNISYTVPTPPAPAPDIIPDSCHIVVLVYKVGSPMNSNAEIQQAVQVSLIDPNYAATLESPQADRLADSASPVQYTALLRNVGVLEDTYTVGLQFDGPSSWDQSFTTVNGTFPIGQTDSITLQPGDSTTITVEVNPNGEIGFGTAVLEFLSQNNIAGSQDFRLATFGLDVLIVADDDGAGYEHYTVTEMNNLGASFGVVSSAAVIPAGSNLNTFGGLVWNTGLTEPALNADEITALENYLDNGGGLYLNGLDIAYQLADPASPYYSTDTEQFFTNYLHATYHTRNYASQLAEGISGDPVTDGILHMGLSGGSGASTINIQLGRYANHISPNGISAAPIFHYFMHSSDYLGIRAEHVGPNGNSRVIFTTFGFETIATDAHRAQFAQGISNWLSGPSAIGEDPGGQTAGSFRLLPNYPNPFNPETHIRYVLPAGEQSRQAVLTVYNQLGQKVALLVDQPQGPGSYEVTWNGRDDAGTPAGSGVYFYTLRYGDYEQTQKMILLR